jgi:hypothetical protein
MIMPAEEHATADENQTQEWVGTRNADHYIEAVNAVAGDRHQVH